MREFEKSLPQSGELRDMQDTACCHGAMLLWRVEALSRASLAHWFVPENVRIAKHVWNLFMERPTTHGSLQSSPCQ